MDLIAEQEDLTSECREMLAKCAPHALGIPAPERHAYQTAHVDTLAGILHKIKDARERVVAEAEAVLAALKEESGTLDATLEKATAQVAASKDAHATAEAETVKTSEAVRVAKGTLQEARDHLQAIESDKQAAENTRDSFTTFLKEQWEPVKEGGDSFTKQHWSVKKKVIAQVVEALQVAGAEDSLTEAIQMVAKTTNAQRGPFAEKTVVFAQRAFDKHATTLAQACDFEAETETRKAAENAADSAVVCCDGFLSVAQDALVIADNVLLADNATLRKAEEARKSLDPRQFEAAAAIEQAMAELADVVGRIAEFEKFRCATADISL